MRSLPSIPTFRMIRRNPVQIPAMSPPRWNAMPPARLRPAPASLPPHLLLLVLFCFLFLFPGPRPALGAAPKPEAPAPSQVRSEHLTVEMVSLAPSVQPGGTTQVGLHFLLDPGWHVYWVNAGDSGEPPSVHWSLPPGISVGPMQYPAPRRLPLGPLMDYGYENEVLLPMTLRADAGLPAPSAAPLPAKVNWLVCREVCIPGKAQLLLPMQISTTQPPADPARQALFQRFQARLPRPLPGSARAVFAATPTGFTLAVTGISLPGAQFFPLDQNQIDNAAPQKANPVAGGIDLGLKKDSSLGAAPAALSGVLVTSDGAAYLVRAKPGALPAAGPAGGLAALLRISAFAFAGGVLLNLMPCVFPVLFLKGLSLVQSSGEQRSRLRNHGLVYALGILLSFWAVATLLFVLRAAGNRLGWGFQFQSPEFLALIAMLLFFLGLSLAGLFDIGLTWTSAGSGLASRQGYAGSFFTGVLAMVVATPCTAPFMGAAIGFALSQSMPVGLTVFTALALGLAAPYVALTFNSAWMRLLPRPGAWMEVLKQATAIPIFATVIWLIWLFAQTAGANALIGVLSAFLLLAISGWILGRWPARRAAALWALLAIALAIAAPIYALRSFAAPALGAANPRGAPGDPWRPFSPQEVDRLLAQGRPVFVDFTANWCLSCQVNERVVLDRGDIQKRLRGSGIALLRAGWTRHDEGIAQALNRLGRSGVPTYVIYTPTQPPQILPEVLTPGIVFSALDRLPSQATGQAQNRESLAQQ